MKIEQEVFTMALDFADKYNLEEPPTNRGILHDYIHAKLGLGISVFDELIIKEIEYFLDGKEAEYDCSPYAEYLYSTLPKEFKTLWRSDEFK